MAFSTFDLTVVDWNENNTIWKYTSSDSLATILGANYWDAAVGAALELPVRAGDSIIVYPDSGLTTTNFLNVATVTASAVTVRATASSYNGRINAEEFGILPDGVDHSAKLTALLPGTGATVCLEFGLGRYVLHNREASATDILILRGKGEGATTIEYGSATSTVGGGFFTPVGGGGLEIHDLKMEADATAETSTDSFRSISDWQNDGGTTTGTPFVVDRLIVNNVWFDNGYTVFRSFNFAISQDLTIKRWRMNMFMATNMRRAVVLMDGLQRGHGRDWMFTNFIVDGVGYNARNAAATLTFMDHSTIKKLSYNLRELPYRSGAVVTGSVSSFEGTVEFVEQETTAKEGAMYVNVTSGTPVVTDVLNTTNPALGTAATVTAVASISVPQVGETFTSILHTFHNASFKIDSAITSTTAAVTDVTRLSDMKPVPMPTLGGMYYFQDDVPLTSAPNQRRRWWKPNFGAVGGMALTGDMGGVILLNESTPFNTGTTPVNEVMGFWIGITQSASWDTDAADQDTIGGSVRNVIFNNGIVKNIGGFEIKSVSGGMNAFNVQIDSTLISNIIGENGPESSNASDTEWAYSKTYGTHLLNCHTWDCGIGGGGSGVTRFVARNMDAPDEEPETPWIVAGNRFLSRREFGSYARPQVLGAGIFVNNVCDGPNAGAQFTAADGRGRRHGPKIIAHNQFVRGMDLNAESPVASCLLVACEGASSTLVQGNIIDGTDGRSGAIALSYVGDQSKNLTIGFGRVSILDNHIDFFNWSNASQTGWYKATNTVGIKSRFASGIGDLIEYRGNKFGPCTHGIFIEDIGHSRRLVIVGNEFDPATGIPIHFSTVNSPNGVALYESTDIRDNGGYGRFDDTHDHGAAIADGSWGTTRTITVTGAAAGDDVAAAIVSGDALTEMQLVEQAKVTAANTVSFNLKNESGGALDASATRWRGDVSRIGPPLCGVTLTGSLFKESQLAGTVDSLVSDVVSGGHQFDIQLFGADFPGSLTSAQQLTLIRGMIDTRSSPKIEATDITTPYQPGEACTFSGGGAGLIYGCHYSSGVSCYANIEVTSGSLADGETVTGDDSGASGTYEESDIDDADGWGAYVNSIANTAATRIASDRVRIVLPALASVDYTSTWDARKGGNLRYNLSQTLVTPTGGHVAERPIPWLYPVMLLQELT